MPYATFLSFVRLALLFLSWYQTSSCSERHCQVLVYSYVSKFYIRQRLCDIEETNSKIEHRGVFSKLLGIFFFSGLSRNSFYSVNLFCIHRAYECYSLSFDLCVVTLKVVPVIILDPLIYSQIYALVFHSLPFFRFSSDIICGSRNCVS